MQNLIGSTEACVSPMAVWQSAQDVPQREKTGRGALHTFLCCTSQIHLLTKTLLSCQLYPNNTHIDVYWNVVWAQSAQSVCFLFFCSSLNLVISFENNFSHCVQWQGLWLLIYRSHTHFIIAHSHVNKHNDSLITQGVSSCICCLVFSITPETNCHRFLPYYQDLCCER